MAAIDRLNRDLGRVSSWLVLGIVLLGAWNAVARYLGKSTGTNLSSNAYLELQWYLFSLLFLLGAAYTLQRDEHVRVDVLSHRLSARARAWIDLLGHLVFLVPFCLLGLWTSWLPVRNSWAILEQSPDPGGLPRFPIKTAIPIAFALLLLQGLVALARCVERVRSPRGAGS